MTTPGSSRKMRRPREGSGTNSNDDIDHVNNTINNNNNDCAPSGFDIYNMQGDSATAHDIFLKRKASSPHSSFANQYNCMLLSNLTNNGNANSSGGGGGCQEMLEQMNQLEAELFDDAEEETKNPPHHQTSSSLSSARKSKRKKRDDMIRAHNRALVLLTMGEYRQAADICLNKLDSLKVKKLIPDEELANVSSRIALLLLECVLALSVGGRTTTTTTTTTTNASNNNNNTIPSPSAIFDWLEECFDSEKDPQLKFLLNLYKSRVGLATLDKSGKHSDLSIRLARKELKQAMDVFQHKLRPKFGGADNTSSSVVSANSEKSAEQAGTTAETGNGNNSTTPYEQQQPASSVILQKHNRSALSLKANSEQLKGNTKKSLILCSEALASVTSENNGNDDNVDSAYYEAVHANNLAVVYETIGKRHLALHALAKGLLANNNNNNTRSSSSSSSSCRFYKDGTARPDQTLVVLRNAALCALSARNYVAAYECMATYCVATTTTTTAGTISNSPQEQQQQEPRCWLRMAEACVGIFSELHNKKSQSNNSGDNSGDGTTTNTSKFATVEIDGEPKCIIIDNALFTDQPEIINEDLVPTLASAEDLEQVKRNPLVRARACLEHALQFEQQLGDEELCSAHLTLAFVHLAFRNYKDALVAAKLVLQSPEPTVESSSSSSPDEVTRRSHKRRVATARMYAAEASCALGETTNAMKFLVGDGQDDAFDRLASDLSGVTIETAATNGNGKRRLARAQTVVRSSASAVTAAMGNLTAAKQLAMSAQAMEDAYASNRERSSARRALIYTLLRGGHHGPALSLLRSLR